MLSALIKRSKAHACTAMAGIDLRIFHGSEEDDVDEVSDGGYGHQQTTP